MPKKQDTTSKPVKQDDGSYIGDGFQTTPDFPLFAHVRGTWKKKINGKQVSFGPWRDWEAALERYEAHERQQAAKRSIKPGFTLEYAVNAFLHDRKQRGTAGRRQLEDYKYTFTALMEHFTRERDPRSISSREWAKYRETISKHKSGKLKGKPKSPTSITNTCRHLRALANFCRDKLAFSLDVGDSLRNVPARERRKHRNNAAPKEISPDEARLLLDHCDEYDKPLLKAGILLGLNCGFLKADIAHLPLTLTKKTSGPISLDGNVLSFPRTKTQSKRRFILWPETLEAMHAYLRVRPKQIHRSNASADERFQRWFLRPNGLPLDGQTGYCPLFNAFRDSCAILQIKKGLCGTKSLQFAGLRTTFSNVLHQSRSNQMTIKFLMGHVGDVLTEHYIRGGYDQELQEASDAVHRWLESASGAKLRLHAS